MDKFVVRLQGNKTCDPQSSNADYIAKNTLEKPSSRTEQQVPCSSRNEHELSPPRQKQIVLDTKKGTEGKIILIEHFCHNAEQDKTFSLVCKATRREETQTKMLPHHRQRDTLKAFVYEGSIN